MSEPLEEIQDAILEKLHAGEPVDREAVLAQHPEHAEALGRFFAVVDVIEEEPAPTEPAPGRLGEFRIVREIGRGGMGVVYEAEQASLKRTVALKVLPPALRQDPRILARFRREAEAAGRLRHPNVVPVYSFGEAGGAPFFAMELVEGVSLADLIRARREGSAADVPDEPEEYRRWAIATIAKVADALAYAHGRGILHRDVKPANILMEEDGTPRLADFGLALDLEATSLTVTGEVFGSPQYMSPEQAFRREQPLDARTDVYSLAVTLYELLTLRIPYHGTTNTEVLTALHAGDVVAPRKADPNVPQDIERVLLRALRRDPDDRYQTAGEFAEDLRAVLEGTPVAAPPPPRRRRVWWAAGAAALLAAVALYLVPTGQNGSEEPSGGPVPDFETLAQLADGTHPDGPAVIDRWIKPGARFRHVIARNSEPVWTCTLSYSYPERAPEDVFLLARCEFSVNRGPWRHWDQSPILIDFIQQGIDHGRDPDYGRYCRIQAVLGDAIRDRTVELAYRWTVRVARRPAAWDEMDILEIWERGKPFELESGTVHTWASDPATLFIYDEYPADYPEKVTDPELDAQLPPVLTPVLAQFEQAFPNALRFTLWYGQTESPLPVPVACAIDLYARGGATVIGTATVYSGEGAQRTATINSVQTDFFIGASPSEEEKRFLLDLRSGKLEAVRLVFRPSRKAALEQSDCNRYWAGTFSETVRLADDDEISEEFTGRVSAPELLELSETPGSITAGELAAMIQDWPRARRRGVIAAIAPHIRRPISEADKEKLTAGMPDADRTAVEKALAAPPKR